MQSTVELAESYIKNSEDLTKLFQNLKLDEGDILASFDIIFLYSNIPIDEALRKIARYETFPIYVLELSEHCLKNTYFLYKQQYYRQTEGAPMGSSLSKVIANLFMEYFEILKPKLWKRYIGDIFVIWPHGKENFLKVLEHLNGIH